jgi:hypothetical protein
VDSKTYALWYASVFEFNVLNGYSSWYKARGRLNAEILFDNVAQVHQLKVKLVI